MPWRQPTPSRPCRVTNILNSSYKQPLRGGGGAIDPPRTSHVNEPVPNIHPPNRVVHLQSSGLWSTRSSRPSSPAQCFQNIGFPSLCPWICPSVCQFVCPWTCPLIFHLVFPLMTLIFHFVFPWVYPCDGPWI
jgi:hypothetical protein